MSTLSNIFSCYKKSLDDSMALYQESYDSYSKNVLQFHDDFLNKLIIDYSEIFSRPHTMNLVNEKINEYFQTNELQFVAIDGTCSADSFDVKVK